MKLQRPQLTNMNYNISQAIEILQRTPSVLTALLKDLPDHWTHVNEGGETWSAYDVVGHLIHGERTDWPERMDIILAEKGDRKFKPFDRFAQFKESQGKSLNDLLREFEELRNKNLQQLKSRNISDSDLNKTGIHPVFGEVTLAQLLSTWVVHDLNHLSQISRVMANRYREDVGPWIEYLRILKPIS